MVEPAKKGPKGICDFNPFLPKIIKIIPIIAPKAKDKNKAIKILGQPRTKPIKKANLTSPKPIQFPLEMRTKAKKNDDATIALKIENLKIKN